MFIHCLKSHDVNSHFLKWENAVHVNLDFRTAFQFGVFKSDVESIPFSRFSEQESNVNQTSGRLKFIKIVLNSI